MPLQIIRNDIVNMEVDAVVNTANPEPVVGRGTDSAVFVLKRTKRDSTYMMLF